MSKNGVKHKIIITTSTFGESDKTSLQELQDAGYEFVLNPHRRTLTEEEAAGFVREQKPLGILAGTEPVTRKVMESAEGNLKVISRVGSGWDNVDRGTAEKLGISVCRAPKAVAQAVVELTLGLFFDLARKISCHDRSVRRGEWKKQTGVLISGKRAGIVGCGHVGKGVALALRKLGCGVSAYDVAPDKEWFSENHVELMPSLDALFEKAALISIHASYSKELRHFVNEERLSRCGHETLLVNVARGEMVDESALYRALKEKKIAGAALDVYEKEPYHGPLTELENVILLPHVGSYAKESRVLMEREAVENLILSLKRR